MIDTQIKRIYAIHNCKTIINICIDPSIICFVILLIT